MFKCADLIKGLLKANPKERIGFNDIYAHPWVKKFAAQLSLDLADYIQ
jgi:hypothetical protein